MLADAEVPEGAKGVVVFFHGYKGFKDWGCWNLVARRFAENGWAFFKANFSHNGTTLEQPIEFDDLDGFAANTYSKEVADGCAMVEFAAAHRDGWGCASKPIVLIGHSRGAGIAALVAARQTDVSKLVTWAGVSDFGARFPSGKALDDWRNSGTLAVVNARTGQVLEHSFDWYLDFCGNAAALDIRSAIHGFDRPLLVVHAGDDDVVHVSEAFKLGRWSHLSTLKVIPSGGHTFNAKHPWDADQMPEALAEVCATTLDFIA